MFRSSTGDLAFHDDPPRRPERWDRDKFERVRDRRAPRAMERDRFVEEDFYEAPRRHRTDIFEDVSDTASRALAPFRRSSIAERDMERPALRPARPRFLRRQSSLDTFDRRPMPRYGDRERDHDHDHDHDHNHDHNRGAWRPPVNVPIPLPVRQRHRSQSHHAHSRRSQSRPAYDDDDYEDLRYRDVSPHGGLHEVEVHRERKHRQHRSHSRPAKSVARSSSSSDSSREEESPKRRVGKRGRTRLPKRLVRREAVIDLNFPFEEEEDFIIVRRALGKEHIDKLISISEKYSKERTTYVYDDKMVVMAPQHGDHHHHHHPHGHSGPPARKDIMEKRYDESNHIAGPLAVLVPEERDRRLVQYERETDYDVERHQPRREFIRVEKDRKGKVPPKAKLIGAMMATLT